MSLTEVGNTGNPFTLTRMAERVGWAGKLQIQNTSPLTSNYPPERNFPSQIEEAKLSCLVSMTSLYSCQIGT